MIFKLSVGQKYIHLYTRERKGMSIIDLIDTDNQLEDWQLFQLPIYRHFEAAFLCYKVILHVFLLSIQNWDPKISLYKIKDDNQ